MLNRIQVLESCNTLLENQTRLIVSTDMVIEKAKVVQHLLDEHGIDQSDRQLLQEEIEIWSTSLYVTLFLKNRIILKLVRYTHDKPEELASMTIQVDDMVRVGVPRDNQMHPDYSGRAGTIKGAYFSEDDAEPLLAVLFDNGKTLFFWQQELIPLLTV